MVDMAHIAGLVAAGLHPSPVPYAHITTTTTHKTLRGPRGGLILTNDAELAKKINSAIFPGIQGGPLEHVIAAKAVAFKEALDPAFKEYAANVIKNSQAMADVFLQISVSFQAEQRTTFSLSTSLKLLKMGKWRKICWMKSISPSTRTLFLMKPCLHLRPVGFGLVQQPSPLVVLVKKKVAPLLNS